MANRIRRRVIKAMGTFHGSQGVEDLRQLGIWIQVVECKKILGEPHEKADLEIRKIEAKYPDFRASIHYYSVETQRVYHRIVDPEYLDESFTDGHGKEHLTWCLKTFGKRWEDG